jgi:hypothetical protein
VMCFIEPSEPLRARLKYVPTLMILTHDTQLTLCLLPRALERVGRRHHGFRAEANRKGERVHHVSP